MSGLLCRLCLPRWPATFMQITILRAMMWSIFFSLDKDETSVNIANSPGLKMIQLKTTQHSAAVTKHVGKHHLLDDGFQ